MIELIQRNLVDPESFTPGIGEDCYQASGSGYVSEKQNKAVHQNNTVGIQCQALEASAGGKGAAAPLYLISWQLEAIATD